MQHSPMPILILIALTAIQLRAQSTGAAASIRFPARFATSALHVSASATDANGTTLPIVFQPALRYQRIGAAITSLPVETSSHRTITLSLTAAATITALDPKAATASRRPTSVRIVTVDSMKVPLGAGTGSGSTFQEMLTGRLEIMDAESGAVIGNANTLTLVVVRTPQAHDTSVTRQYVVDLADVHARSIVLRLVGERLVAQGLESQCSAPIASVDAGATVPERKEVR